MGKKERCFICHKAIREQNAIKYEEHCVCSEECKEICVSKRQEIIYEDPQFGYGY